MVAAPTPLTLFLVVEEAAGLQLLQALARTPHRIAGVATTPGDATGVERCARRLDLPVWPAGRVRDPALAEVIRAAGVDLLLNVHSLHVIATAVLDAPRLGAYNLHPGPLPEYAGLNAPSWAIFNGETSHAVTLHRMSDRIDAGPMVVRADFPIGPGDTALAVYTRCVKLGLPLVLDLVERCARDPGGVEHHPIPAEGRRAFGRRPPNDGWIDWDWPAVTIADFARACAFGPFPSPWGLPRTRLGDGRVVGVTRLRPPDRPPAPPAIAPLGMAPLGMAPLGMAPPGTVLAVAEGGGVCVAARGGVLVLQNLVADGKRLAAETVLAPGHRLLGRAAVIETRGVS